MPRRLTAVLLCSAFVLVACGSDEVPELTPAPLPTAAPGATGLPAGEATISIVSPEDGATIEGETLKVATEVGGFELVDKMGEDAKAGEGHIIYYVWNGFGPSDYEVPTALGQPANAGGTGYVAAASAEASYEWVATFVRPGEQSIVVQLVNSDHTPLDPPQTTRVTVTISGSATSKPPSTKTNPPGGDPADDPG